jgi:hypothetical protein
MKTPGGKSAVSGLADRFAFLTELLPPVALVVAPAPIWAREVRFDRVEPLIEALAEAGMSELLSVQLLTTCAVWSVAARRIAFACGPAKYDLAGSDGGYVVFIRADRFLSDCCSRTGASLPAQFPSESAVIAMRDALADQASTAGLGFYEADAGGTSEPSA